MCIDTQRFCKYKSKYTIFEGALKCMMFILTSAALALGGAGGAIDGMGHGFVT